MNRLGLVLVLAVALGTVGFGPPQEVVFDRDGKKLPDSEVNSPAVNWEIVKTRGGASLNGVGQLDNGFGFCTVTLLNTGGLAEAPAYALTNGHCPFRNLTGPDEIVVDRPASHNAVVKFNFFVDAGAAVVVTPVRRVLYSTMKNTDAALLELDATYGQLHGRGIRSYAIDDVDPRQGEPVEMVGVPGSGVRRSQRFVRRSICEIGGRANLREGAYHFAGAFRHKCSSVGGSSGSPMISRVSGRIVAINNTGVSDAAVPSPECSIDRPCEQRPDGGVTTDFEVNYAQRVSDFPSCFDSHGVFDLRLRSCRLERPAPAPHSRSVAAGE